MRIRVLLCAVFVSFATAAQANPLSFTFQGIGGISTPIAGVSADPFLWLNGGGGVPLEYDFSALSYPGNNWGNGANGSFLISSEFSVEDATELRLSVLLMNYDHPISSWTDSGFALLVQDDSVIAVLINARSNGYAYLGDSGPFPQVMLAPVSAGVTVTNTRPDPGDVTLGSTTYGPGVSSGGCDSCFNHVTSTYTMGPGTYQIVLGQVNRGSAALALTDLTVPEPASVTLVLMGIAGAVARRRLTRSSSKRT